MNNNVLFHRSSHQTNNFPSSSEWAEHCAPPPSPGPSPGPLVSVPSENIGWKNQHLSRWLFMDPGPHTDHRWGPWGLTCHPGHYPCGHHQHLISDHHHDRHTPSELSLSPQCEGRCTLLSPLSTEWAGLAIFGDTQSSHNAATSATGSYSSVMCHKLGDMMVEVWRNVYGRWEISLFSSAVAADDLSISSGEKFYSGDNP